MYMANAFGIEFGVVRIADGLHIPPDPKNMDWVEYLTWAKSNVVLANPETAIIQANLEIEKQNLEAKAKANSLITELAADCKIEDVIAVVNCMIVAFKGKFPAITVLEKKTLLQKIKDAYFA